MLWLQSHVVKNPAAALASRDHVECIYRLDGENDQYYDGSSLHQRTFDLFALTNRVFLGNPQEKLPRFLDVRMYGQHRDDFLREVGGSPDTNLAYIAFLPEQSAFDLNNQAQTTANTSEYAATVTAWPDQRLTDTCFWQNDTNNSSAVGRWDNGSTVADKYWLSKAVFDKRFDIRGHNTQFMRFAFWKKVDSVSHSPLHIISASVSLNQDTRGRRR